MENSCGSQPPHQGDSAINYFYRTQFLFLFLTLTALCMPAAAQGPDPAHIQPDITVLILSSYNPQSARLFSDSKNGLTVQLGTIKKQAQACGVSLVGDTLGVRCGGMETEQYRAITVSDVSRPVCVEIPGKESHCYHGSIIVEAGTSKLHISNIVSLEDYLTGVVAGELDSEEPAAMQAQAVLSRTWVLKNRMKHGSSGVCDLTHCQVYKGIDGETKRAREAVRRTSGQVITWNGQLIDVYFHSTSGGRTTSPANAWGGDTPPYLQGVDDPWSEISPHHMWDTTLTSAEIRKLGFEAFNGSLLSVEVTEKTPDGRAKTVAVRLSTKTLTFTGQEFHTIIGRTLGWNYLKSDWFNAVSQSGRILFTGRGLGHGVGLCQWGAIGMARKRHDYKEIIKYYFPGVEVEPWAGLFQQLPQR
jgi:stage II sporulation protein D